MKVFLCLCGIFVVFTLGFTSLLSEFLIDSNLIYVPDNNYKQTTSVSFDGVNYFVVWADERGGDNYDIYGARVTPAGAVLDSSGIIISSASSGRKWSAVAFDGTNYLVVWADWRNNEVADIYGARVTTSGIVLDPSGIPISTANDGQVRCSVAFDGTNYLVVWDDYRVGWPLNDIYGARVTPGGIVLEPDGIPICTAPSNQSYPDVAFDGSNYLVVWHDFRNGVFEIYGTRVTPSGTILDPDGIPISANASANGGFHPQIAFDGVNYLVVWDDYSDNIVGTRISPNGTVLDNAIGISTGSWQEIFPIITYNGTSYFVAWDDYRSPPNYKIYGSRVTTDGIVLDPGGIKIFDQFCAWQDPAGIASDGTNFLTALLSSNYILFGVRTNSQGVILDTTGILISYAGYAEYSPSVSFDGTNYLAVWQDERNRNGDIYGARVSSQGSVLDSTSISISVNDSLQSSPAVSFDGTNYFIVWQDKRGANNDIYGARVSIQGIVFDSSGIIISSANGNQEKPAIDFDGTNYLVVWQDSRNGNYDIYGTRIDTSGTILDPTGIPISIAANSQSIPSIVFGGANYLVVWQDYRNSLYEIYGARITPSGNVLDPSGILIATAGPNWNPQVSFDGNNFFVVWGAGLSFDQDIYGTRISQDGIILDPGGITIAGVGGNQCQPCAVFDGTNYLVIWQDQRNGDNYDIYGSRVTTDGIVLDPDGLELLNQPFNRTNPALGKGLDNQLLLCFEGFVAESYNNLRIFGALCEDVGVEEENKAEIEKLEVYPNPFRNHLVIKFQIPNSKYQTNSKFQISLKIYDATGRVVKNLSFHPASFIIHNSVEWDGTDNSGRRLPTGIYFVRFEAGNYKQTEKVILLK